MRTNVLRAVAVALGLGVCTAAQAQTSYVAPAHWSNFRTASAPVAMPVSDEAALPAPAAEMPAPIPAPQADSAYTQAMSEPWEGGAGAASAPRLPLAPYFGSVNLLFFDLEENTRREIATGVGGFNSTNVEPDSSVGLTSAWDDTSTAAVTAWGSPTCCGIPNQSLRFEPVLPEQSELPCRLTTSSLWIRMVPGH